MGLIEIRQKRAVFLKAQESFLIGKKCIIFPSYDASEGINLSGKINQYPFGFDNCRPTCRKGTLWIYKNKEQAVMLGIINI